MWLLKSSSDMILKITNLMRSKVWGPNILIILVTKSYFLKIFLIPFLQDYSKSNWIDKIHLQCAVKTDKSILSWSAYLHLISCSELSSQAPLLELDKSSEERKSKGLLCHPVVTLCTKFSTNSKAPASCCCFAWKWTL